MFEGISPADICNRALDSLGCSDMVVGDIEEGTEAAKVALRAYGPCFRQLLRSAHWDFARKQVPLTLLADATGQTPYVGTVVPTPWVYEYAAPIDMVKARFLPWNSNPQSPNPPLMTGLTQPPLNAVRLRPAPYLLAMDNNYPVVVGAPPAWSQYPEWWLNEGVAPTSRNVILTNVPPTPQAPQSNVPTVFPSMVYTALIVYPSQWDDLFQEAMVQYLAQKIAMGVVKDKKFARVLRDDAIKIVIAALSEARAVNANESGYPQTTDHTPDWIRARDQGGARGCGNFGSDFGSSTLWGSWDSCSFSNGNVY